MALYPPDAARQFREPPRRLHPLGLFLLHLQPRLEGAACRGDHAPARHGGAIVRAAGRLTAAAKSKTQRFERRADDAATERTDQRDLRRDPDRAVVGADRHADQDADRAARPRVGGRGYLPSQAAGVVRDARVRETDRGGRRRGPHLRRDRVPPARPRGEDPAAGAELQRGHRRGGCPHRHRDRAGKETGGQRRRLRHTLRQPVGPRAHLGHHLRGGADPSARVRRHRASPHRTAPRRFLHGPLQDLRHLRPRDVRRRSPLRPGFPDGGRRGGTAGHHRAGLRGPGGENPEGGRGGGDRTGILADRPDAAQPCIGGEGRRTGPRRRGGVAHEGKPAHRRDHGGHRAVRLGDANLPADEPRSRHGRSHLSQDVHDDRRGGQHRPDPGRQEGHRPERHRPGPCPGHRKAEGGHPVGRRDGQRQHPLHARCGRAVQDGRAGPDYGGHPGRSPGFRQRHQRRGRTDQEDPVRGQRGRGHSAGARSGVSQHALQAAHLPGRGRGGGHRSGDPDPRGPHEPGRLRAVPPGLGGRHGHRRPGPQGREIRGEVTRERCHRRSQRGILEHEIHVLRGPGKEVARPGGRAGGRAVHGAALQGQGLGRPGDRRTNVAFGDATRPGGRRGGDLFLVRKRRVQRRAGRGSGSPGGPRRAGIHATDRREPRDPGRSRKIRSPGAAAPAAQSGRRPQHREALSGHPPGGLLRHVVPHHHPGHGPGLRPAAQVLGAGGTPLRVPRPFLRVHRFGPSGDRQGGGEGADGCGPSGKRRQPVRHAGPEEQGLHARVHRRRGAHDGHPMREPRPGGDAVPDGRVRHECAGPRKAHLQGVGPAGRLGDLERHADASGEHGPAGRRGCGALRIPDQPRAGVAGRRPRGARCAGFHRGNRGERRPDPGARLPCRRMAGAGIRREGKRCGRAPDQQGRESGAGLGDPHRRRADDRPAHAPVAVGRGENFLIRAQCRFRDSRSRLPAGTVVSIKNGLNRSKKIPLAPPLTKGEAFELPTLTGGATRQGAQSCPVRSLPGRPQSG